MSTELIERLAEQTGFRLVKQAGGHNWIYTGSASGRCTEALSRFAALVAEECAKQCDAALLDTSMLTSMPPQSSAARGAAARIRALFPPAP